MGTYEENHRRALNIVWTAAETYHFQPDFLAFSVHHTPELYLNMIIGLVYKHYDFTLLSSFFNKLQNSVLKDTFTDIFWLGLENAVFQRELPNRPILQELRQKHAQSFFSKNTDLSFQQLMVRNGLQHNLQAARWHKVLHESSGLLNPWEKHLFSALEFSATWTTHELIQHMKKIQQNFFILDFQNRQQKIYHIALSARLATYLKKIFPAEIRQMDDVLTKNTVPQCPDTTSSDARHTLIDKACNLLGKQTDIETAAYIEKQFGPSFYSPTQKNYIEKNFCIKNHRNCHLHFTRGPQAGKSTINSMSIIARQQNLAYYNAHKPLYTLTIRLLSARLKNVLHVCNQPLPLPSKHGQLHPPILWRALYLQDPRVFTATQDTPIPNFTVDLLLDASASRAGCQSAIAAQAYTIAESLRRCHIPLQITAYCSLRGYTVLQVFQRYHEPLKSKNVFNYTATGWNRDGLALRAMKELIPTVSGIRRILIMLTDVRPNDAQSIPDKTLPISHSYSEQTAIDDTAAEIQLLRRQGIHVIGLLNGELPNFLPAAQKMFGSDFTRIKKIDQLATSIGKLIQKQITKD